MIGEIVNPDRSLTAGAPRDPGIRGAPIRPLPSPKPAAGRRTRPVGAGHLLGADGSLVSIG